MAKITRAILSVTDKNGLVPFAWGLKACGVELLSTGGTAKLLKESGVLVTEMSDFTGFPEIMDGRVKTLHPKVHGGLLGVRDNAKHKREAQDNAIVPIDMLVCNLYAFEQTIAKPGCTLEDAIENIDIGGPAMIRSSAKNHRFVTVVTDPEDYKAILEEMVANDGVVSFRTNAELARKAFVKTGRYDNAIADYLGRLGQGGELLRFGRTLHLGYDFGAPLRYAENPHQAGAFYTIPGSSAVIEQLHGKELSYNNLLDIGAATDSMYEFLDDSSAVVAILKHTSSCCYGRSGESLLSAYLCSLDYDPDSPFGGIVITNRPWTLELARAVDEIFTEVLIGPEFAPEVIEYLKRKKNRRLIRWYPEAMDRTRLSGRTVLNGALFQEQDNAMENPRACKVVTKRQPTEGEYQAMEFGWKIVKAARSNAVVFAAPNVALAIGSGATARVDAVHVARDKAKRVGANLGGSVLASEAFFPFRDGVDIAVKAGATAIVQPGGSVRDDEVIAAADEHGIAMVFTGVRHFRH